MNFHSKFQLPGNKTWLNHSAESLRKSISDELHTWAPGKRNCRKPEVGWSWKAKIKPKGKSL